VDLAGPFPPDEEGNRWLAVAVDVYSKWVEAFPLKSKHAFVTASWLYNEILARWGKPEFLRCDHGAEWEAEFRRQCRQIGIVMNQGATGNSRANGQAERIIRSIKDVLRRFMTMERTAYWSDGLPYCLMALRHTPQASHRFPPFTVVTGTTPVLPTTLPDPDLVLPQDPTA
jgi:transposase InsO family protein